MSQVSYAMRRVAGGFLHWCPGCERPHIIPTEAPYTIRWDYTGPSDRPSFAPSVKFTDKAGVACHYFVTAGEIQFCADSRHKLAGQRVKLPDLPDYWTDDLRDPITPR